MPLVIADEQSCISDEECTQNQFYRHIRERNALLTFSHQGYYEYNIQVPPNAEKLQVTASFSNADLGNAETTVSVYQAYSPNITTTIRKPPHTDHTGHNPEEDVVVKREKFYIYVWSSTRTPKVGEFTTFHVKTNFAFPNFDWLIMSKDIVLVGGRELGNNIHPEVVTFSIVVSAEMSPGFTILVWAAIPHSNQLIAGVHLPCV